MTLSAWIAFILFFLLPLAVACATMHNMVKEVRKDWKR